MSSYMQSRAPKRRIERVFNRVRQSASTTQANQNIHTVEDTKTLVRMIGEISIISLVGDGSIENFAALLHVAPSGVAVASPGVAQLSDQDSPLQRLAEWNTHLTSLVTAAAGGGFITKTWKFDIKAQRKLKPGDIIKFSQISDSAASNIVVAGTIDLWFKE